MTDTQFLSEYRLALHASRRVQLVLPREPNGSRFRSRRPQRRDCASSAEAEQVRRGIHGHVCFPERSLYCLLTHNLNERELHLQIKLIELQNLLKQTQHEPRLKGPFPVKLYRSILASLQTILDRLHSMRCVTTREEWYTVRRINRKGTVDS
jgi:hypothetical protein